MLEVWFPSPTGELRVRGPNKQAERLVWRYGGTGSGLK